MKHEATCKQNRKPRNQRYDDIKENLEAIIISHGHEDHVADALYLAQKNDAIIVSNFEIVSWFEKKGVSGHPMNFGGSWDFDFGKVKT